MGTDSFQVVSPQEKDAVGMRQQLRMTANDNHRLTL